MADQQFCLRWNNHQNTLISVFDTLLEGEILVDCTLAAEGKFLKAHKVVLSACSPFFNDLLRQHYEQHPILILKDVKFDQLKAMLDYMYRGEVKISQDQLGTFLKAAESLQIKGLSDHSESQAKQKSANEGKSSRPSSKVDDDHKPSGSRSPNHRRRKRRHPSGSCDDLVSEENSNDQSCEPNTPPPLKRLVESRLSNPPSPPTVPQDTEAAAPGEAPRIPSYRALPVPTSVMYNKSDPPHQQPSSLVDSLVFEPKSEFIELDEEEDMNQEDDAAEAGPSHSQDDSGTYNWHMDRPEDSFLTQESPSGPRNAQGYFGMWQEYMKMNYVCPKCNKNYKNRGTLIRHLRFECGVEAQFMCHLCNFACKQRYNLTLHLRRQHPNETVKIPKQEDVLNYTI